MRCRPRRNPPLATPGTWRGEPHRAPPRPGRPADGGEGLLAAERAERAGRPGRRRRPPPGASFEDGPARSRAAPPGGRSGGDAPGGGREREVEEAWNGAQREA